MTRDFIFDASGAVIGYRCRLQLGTIENHYHGLAKSKPAEVCNRLFPTVRGLRLHQRLSHGLFKQLSLKEVEALEKRNEL